MTTEQFDKATILQRELRQLSATRNSVEQFGIIRDASSTSWLQNKEWLEVDLEITKIVISKIDDRIKQISKEIEEL